MPKAGTADSLTRLMQRPHYYFRFAIVLPCQFYPEAFLPWFDGQQLDYGHSIRAVEIVIEVLRFFIEVLRQSFLPQKLGKSKKKRQRNHF
jgi:hypothetical protein